MSLKKELVFPRAIRTNEIQKNNSFNLSGPQPQFNFGYGKHLYRADEAAFYIRSAVGMTDRNIPSFLDENSRTQKDGRGNEFALGFITHEVYRGRRYYSRETLDKLIKYLKEDQESKDTLREASGSERAMSEMMAQLTATSEYEARIQADTLAEIEAELTAP